MDDGKVMVDGERESPMAWVCELYIKLQVLCSISLTVSLLTMPPPNPRSSPRTLLYRHHPVVFPLASIGTDLRTD
jgi:hypothetical protein